MQANLIPSPNIDIYGLPLLRAPLRDLQAHVTALPATKKRLLLDRLRGLQFQMVALISEGAPVQPPYDFDAQEDLLLDAASHLEQPLLVINRAIEHDDVGPIHEWFRVNGFREANTNVISTNFLRIRPEKPESVTPLLNRMSRLYESKRRSISAQLVRVQRDRSEYESTLMAYTKEQAKKEQMRQVLPKIDALIALLEKTATESTALLGCDPKQKGCLQRLRNVFRGTQKGGRKSRHPSKGHAIRHTRRHRRTHHLL